MEKVMNVLLGAAFLALGVLGITGLIPMFKTDMVFVNVGEIVLGSLGILVGLSVRKNQTSNQQSKDNAQQRKEIHDQRNENYNQKVKENEHLQKENIEKQKDYFELQRKNTEQQKEIDELKKKKQ